MKTKTKMPQRKPVKVMTTKELENKILEKYNKLNTVTSTQVKIDKELTNK